MNTDVAFSPRFAYTDAMVADLMAIEAAARLVDVLPLPPERAFAMKYEARQRSTHFSTSIEGNLIALEDVRRGIAEADRTGNAAQQEVRNYWAALEWLEEQADAQARIDEAFIRRLHRIIIVRTRGRRGEMSDYRTHECPVVDSLSGQIDYGPPKPEDVGPLMATLASWRASSAAQALPGPIRAGIMAYQLVTIHPFGDGNGRTARAMATAELWLSGYRMRGYLSMEEYYYAELQRYYDSLQMGLDVDYYQGRNDADLSPWLTYFIETMRRAAESVSQRALSMWEGDGGPEPPPWEALGRRQQQVLMRLVVAEPEAAGVPEFSVTDVVAWFGVSSRTARDWLGRWRDVGFCEPASGTERITAWKLAAPWRKLVGELR